jgi:carboxyl-terminal processing protease
VCGRFSWAIVPTYSDLSIERRGTIYLITAVRNDSPAAQRGITAGDQLVAVGRVPTDVAVNAFWGALGFSSTPGRADYAARVLAAGRRYRSRELTILHKGVLRDFDLPSLYSKRDELPPVTVSHDSVGRSVIRLNNSVGDLATIAAFDAAMAALPATSPLVIDLTDTPSGGNTSVARAIMSWFVDRPRSYQIHRLPAEERETGIARQWIEQVLPRPRSSSPAPSGAEAAVVDGSAAAHDGWEGALFLATLFSAGF